MKTIHSIIVCVTLFVSSISFVFGYNKAKDGTYYADFNGDDIINIQDIILLLDLIL